jgi:putative membrane protein
MLSSKYNFKFYISVVVLVAFYTSGIIGILTNSQTIDFLSLTPLNLLVNLLILLLNHQNATHKQWFIFVGIVFASYFIEVIGVNTGVVFGSYVYGSTLGFKVFATPIIIGVNWLLLTYAAVYTFEKKVNNTLLIALGSACILVILDFLIEPVAMNYDFWNWDESVIPFQNYLAWFCISFVFCYFLALFKQQSKNNIAPFLVVLQFIFFGIFNFVTWM